jgi:hypothetical protein
MSYLKKIFDNVNADLRKIDFWLHFEDLETLQNKFQKYPVFIPNEIYTKINRRASVGREFRNEFTDLITKDPKKLYDEFLGLWVPKYQKLELEILEFENLRANINKEQAYEISVVKPLLLEESGNFFSNIEFCGMTKSENGEDLDMEGDFGLDLTRRGLLLGDGIGMDLEKGILGEKDNILNEAKIPENGNIEIRKNSQEMTVENDVDANIKRLRKITEVRKVYNGHLFVKS